MKSLVIGTGQSAQRFVSTLQSIEHLDFATSQGDGTFLGRDVLSLSNVVFTEYNELIICSQYVDEIFRNLQRYGVPVNQICYFDSTLDTCKNLTEYAEFIAKPSHREMLAVYDLAKNNLSFNFSIFVNNAFVYAGKAGFDSVFFVVLEGDFDYTGFHALGKYSAGQNRWRINHLFQPVVEMSDMCSGFMVTRNRDWLERIAPDYEDSARFPGNAVQAGIFENDYHGSYASGTMAMYRTCGGAQSFRTQPQALSYVDDFLVKLKHNKVITLSIRQTDFQQEKNSSIEDWGKLNAFLIDNGYTTVIVEDILTALTEQHKACFAGAHFFPVAPFNLHMRMALYERAYFNISCASGASTLLYYNPNVRFIAFINELNVYSEEEMEKNSGVKRGENFDYLGEYQRVYWLTDNYQDMRDKFLDWQPKLETIYE